MEITLSVIAVIISLISGFFSFYTFFWTANRDRKQMTPEAYNLLQEQVFDKLNLYSPSNISEIINDKIQPFFCRTTKKELQVPDANDDQTLDVLATEQEQEIFNIICKKYVNNKLALFVRTLQLESNPKMLLQKLDLREFSSILDIADDIDKIDYIDLAMDIKELVDAVDITSKKQACIDKTIQLVSQGKKVIIW